MALHDFYSSVLKCGLDTAKEKRHTEETTSSIGTSVALAAKERLTF